MVTTTLVLGGTRSGKSIYAEQLAAASRRSVVYIATAQAGDDEMALRIAHHRTSRPAHWLTVEEPISLGAAIERYASPAHVVIVDCLTLWLSNLFFDNAAHYPDVGPIDLPPQFHTERAALLEVLARVTGDVVLVSNEIGLGIIASGAVSRCFADEAGRLNQAVARVSQRAFFIAAGLPITLKDTPC